MADTQSRKHLLTINNPQDSGFDHDKIKMILATMKPVVYYCMSDEIAPSTQTPHTHVYIHCKTPVRFSTMQNKFQNCHIDTARGTAEQNRNYVFKLGEKYENTDKEDSRIDGTQEEWGELPKEHQGKKPELAFLLELVESGMTNYEIITKYPDYLFDMGKIDLIRLTLNENEFSEKFRNIEFTYIFGRARTGKTRGVMEKHGYRNVYRVTNYLHPFDTYKGQDIIAFDEFNSSLPINAMNMYTEGQPCVLPSRYSDKMACYTKVYIISNISLEKQYPNVKEDTPQIWHAFTKRINRVIWYKSETEIITYDSTEDFFNRDPITGFKMGIMDF